MRLYEHDFGVLVVYCKILENDAKIKFCLLFVTHMMKFCITVQFPAVIRYFENMTTSLGG